MDTKGIPNASYPATFGRCHDALCGLVTMLDLGRMLANLYDSEHFAILPTHKHASC